MMMLPSYDNLPTKEKTRAKTGNLTAYILKRDAKNKKIYGPYTWPSVPLNVWEEMKNARQRAGTIFWNKYLRPLYYGKTISGQRSGQGGYNTSRQRGYRTKRSTW